VRPFSAWGIFAIIRFTGMVHAPRVIHAQRQINITTGKFKRQNETEKKISFFFYELNL